MRVFVTGATGVLGRRVVPLLSSAGHDVTAVARGKADQVRASGAVPLEIDLFDADALTRVVAGHDAVLDLATRIPGTNRMMLPWAWRDNDHLRTDAAANAADAAIAADARYVRESIGLLYADAGDRWIREDAPLEPAAHTRTALDAEAAAARVTAAGGVGVALRFGMFYGPDASHTIDLLAAAEKGIAGVLGDADGFLSQLHLDDAAAAVVAALAAPPGVYNVAEDEPLRRRDVIALLEDIAGRDLWTPPGVVTRLGPARVVARSLRLSNSSFRDATGWRPRFPSAAVGLRAMLSA